MFRIAVFCPMPADGSYSGGRYHVMMLAQALAARGHEVCLLVNHLPPFDADLALMPGHAALKLHHSKDWERDLPEFDCDYVFFTPGMNMARKYQNAALALAALRRAKLILINFESANWFNALSPAKRDPGLWDSWLRVARYCDAILCSARESVHWAEPFYGERSNRLFEWAYPSINTVAAERARGAAKEDRIVVFLRAKWADHKGGDSLTKVFCEELRGYSFCAIVGSTEVPEEIIASLQREADAFGIRIELRQRLSDVEKFRELARAKALLFPSYFEGFGYPPVEALAVGTNCAAFDLPVLRETCEENLFFAPAGDWDTLREQLVRAVTAPQPAETVQQRIRDLVSLEQFGERLEEILGRLHTAPTFSDARCGDTGVLAVRLLDPALAARWFAQHPERDACLLVSQKEFRSGIELRDELEQSVPLRIVESLPDEDAGEPNAIEQVVIADALPVISLSRHRPLAVPGITHYYGEIQSLRRAGIRRLTLYSHFGTRDLVVDEYPGGLIGRHAACTCTIVGSSVETYEAETGAVVIALSPDTRVSGDPGRVYTLLLNAEDFFTGGMAAWPEATGATIKLVSFEYLAPLDEPLLCGIHFPSFLAEEGNRPVRKIAPVQAAEIIAARMGCNRVLRHEVAEADARKITLRPPRAFEFYTGQGLRYLAEKLIGLPGVKSLLKKLPQGLLKKAWRWRNEQNS